MKCKFSAPIRNKLTCLLGHVIVNGEYWGNLCNGADEDKKDCPFWSGRR